MTVQITEEQKLQGGSDRMGVPDAEWRAAFAHLTGAPPVNLLPLTAAMTEALAVGEAVVAMAKASARSAVARLTPEEQRRALARLEARRAQR